MSISYPSECGYLHPILTSKESQAFESGLFGGDEALEWRGMNHAGRSIANQALLDIQEILGDGLIQHLLLLAGKGHNGGDAIIAARHLISRFPNTKVKIIFPSGLSRLRPLVQRSLDALQIAFGNQIKYLSLRGGSTDAIYAQILEFVGSEAYELCLD